MNHLHILIPIHGREAVVRQCFDSLERFSSRVTQVVTVTCVGDEPWAEALTEERGWQWCRSANSPLGSKLNRGLDSTFAYAYDYLMILGSDNIISPNLMDVYEPYMAQGVGLIGINKCFFYHAESGRVKLVDYNLTPVAGRIISRAALDRVARWQYKVQITSSIAGANYNYDVGDVIFMHASTAEALCRAGHANIISKGHTRLWDDGNNCLDHNSNMRLIFNGVRNKCIDTGDVPYLIDLKTEENIWKFDDIEGKDYTLKHIEPCMRGSLMSV